MQELSRKHGAILSSHVCHISEMRRHYCLAPAQIKIYSIIIIDAYWRVSREYAAAMCLHFYRSSTTYWFPVNSSHIRLLQQWEITEQRTAAAAVANYYVWIPSKMARVIALVSVLSIYILNFFFHRHRHLHATEQRMANHQPPWLLHARLVTHFNVHMNEMHFMRNQKIIPQLQRRRSIK